MLNIDTSELEKRLEKIESLLLKSSKPVEAPRKEILTLAETAEFLDCSKSTIYQRVSKGTIPHVHKGNRLYFVYSELITWLKDEEAL